MEGSGIRVTGSWSKRRTELGPDFSNSHSQCWWSLKTLQFLLFTTFVYKSPVLESFCFWLIKSCICNKIPCFLPYFASTEGIGAVITCLFLTSSVFLWKEIGLLPTRIHRARKCPIVVKATAFVGEQQKKKWQERPPENQGLLLFII